MISRDANFVAEAQKYLSQPVFLAEMELDYQAADASAAAHWQGGQGDADPDTVPGSVICAKRADGSGQNIMPSVASLQSASARFGGSTSGVGYLAFYFLSIGSFKIDSFKIRMRSNPGGSQSFLIGVFPISINDGIEDAGVPVMKYSLYYQYSTVLSLSTSFSEFNVSGPDAPLFGPGKYLLIVRPETAGNIVEFETYYHGQTILRPRLAGVVTEYMQIGELSIKFFDYYNADPLQMDVNGTWTDRVMFDGWCALRELKVKNYVDSQHSSDIVTTRDRQGTAVTPTVNGEVRIEEASPFGTEIAVEIYKIASTLSIANYSVTDSTLTCNTSSAHSLSVNDPIFLEQAAGNSPKHRGFYKVATITDTDTFTVTLPEADIGTTGTLTGGTLHKLTKIGTTFSDGDTITDKQQRYVFNALLTTTKFYLTPRLDAIKVYFKTGAVKYVSGERLFETYRPLVCSLPNYDAILDDPVMAKTRLSSPQLSLWIHREGVSRSLSEAERLVAGYDICGNDLTVKFGFRGIDESSFIAYNRGTINGLKYSKQAVTLECSDVMWKTRDPYGIDDAANGRNLHYPYWHPMDILVDLLQRSRIRDRFIDYNSFSAIKTGLLADWEFFYSSEEDQSEKLKDLMQQVMTLTGVTVYRNEEGKVTAVFPDNGNADLVFSLDENNSEPDGECELNKDKRVNSCAVRRGFFFEPLARENATEQIWDVHTDALSVATTGKNVQLVFGDEYPWVPREAKVGTETLSLIIAKTKVNRFSFGVPIVRRIVPAARFLHLQIGDNGTVKTAQVLGRQKSGVITERSVVLGKKLMDQSRLVLYLWLYQMQA